MAWRVFSQKGLGVGVSSSPQHEGLSILGSQQTDPEELKKDFGCCCLTIENLIIVIEYNWDNTDQRDLDTATEVFGQIAGYACDGNLPEWIVWQGDTIQADTKEEVYVYIGKAIKEELWPDDQESITINLYAGWYKPAGGQGPATVYVYSAQDVVNDDLRQATQQSKAIEPGTQNRCASSDGGRFVGSVTVFRDATFSLE